MDPPDLGTYTTVQAHWNIQNRIRLCDTNMLESVQALACTLSHRRAWQRFLDVADDYDAAFVIEDDVCFRPQFRSVLCEDLTPLFKQPERWDLLLLGYTDLPRAMIGPARRRVHPLGRSAGLELCPADLHHFGAHAYLVHPASARRLLKWSLPAEMHVDLWFATLGELGLLRVYLWPRSLASQCRGRQNASIPHFNLWFLNYKMVLPSFPLWFLFVLVLVLVAVWQRRGLRNKT